MANPEHVEIVRRGKDAIAEWKKHNPLIRLDLNEAHLEGINLDNADLGGASLRGVIGPRAKFSGANLENSTLEGADFTFADFSKATLIATSSQRICLLGASLYGADLSRSNLGSANLQLVNLMFSEFKDTVVSGADFFEASFLETRFDGVDLSNAKNLVTVKHLGPSRIGIDTLFLSHGKIPESFLRECGVPDSLITYLPSLLGAGIDFYSSFISYSHKDEEFAQRLHSRMQEDHLRVWYAPEDMAGGKKLHDQIFDAIRVYDKLLIVLSEYSMNSEWVRTEIRRARKREREEGRKVLFPIRLCGMQKISEWECFDADSGKDLAIELREYYIPDFSDWKGHDSFEAEFKKLLRDLKQPQQWKSREGAGENSG